MTAIVLDYDALYARRRHRHGCSIWQEDGGLMCDCLDGAICAAAVRRCTRLAPADPFAVVRHHCERLGIKAFWARL